MTKVNIQQWSITNDSIYFKYYSQDNDEIGDNCWVRGYIDGDEVTIKSGLKFDRGLYFCSCKYWTQLVSYGDGRYHTLYYAETVDDDVLFKYDANKKWLYTLQDIWITSSYPDKWLMEASSKEGPFWPDDLYACYELIYVPEGPLTPQAPRFTYETDSDGKKYMKLNGSVFSIEGPAMHYDKLKFRIFIDGEQNPAYDYAIRYYGHDFSGWNILQWNVEYDRPFREAYAVMVYKYEDGSEVVSAPAPIVDVSGVDEIFRDNSEDVAAPVYDLSGRRVKPDRLAPGVYIRNGKKFMVR